MRRTGWLGVALAMALGAGVARGQERGQEDLRPDEKTDLSAVSLESSIPYPVPGEKVEIRIGVRNNAQAPAGKVEVRLLADGQPAGTGFLDLAAGETGTLRLPWTPAEEKTYALTATLDPARKRPERDRLDDTATAEVLVAARPAGGADLAVTGLDLVTRADGARLARVSVRNQGTAAAGAPLEVRAGGQAVAQVPVPSVAPGAATVIDVLLASGTSTEQLSAELGSRFRATQKHPEAALLQNDVRAARDLRVEGLSVSATPTETNRVRRLTISFRVVNHGRDAVTSPFRTSVFPGAVAAAGGTLEPYVLTSAGLAAGQSLYVSRTLALPPDVHEFDARVETDLDRAPSATTAGATATVKTGTDRIAVAPFENPAANVGRWVSIGPRHVPEGLGAVGVLFSVVADPASPSTLYVGSHGSGVWKTTDGGSTWSPITDSLPTLQIAALAVDPAQASRVYVATPDFGIFRSEDGGTSWSQVSGAAQLNLTNCCDTLLVDPNHAGGLYLTSFDGIYHSTDRGATWTLSPRGPGDLSRPRRHRRGHPLRLLAGRGSERQGYLPGRPRRRRLGLAGRLRRRRPAGDRRLDQDHPGRLGEHALRRFQDSHQLPARPHHGNELPGGTPGRPPVAAALEPLRRHAVGVVERHLRGSGRCAFRLCHGNRFLGFDGRRRHLRGALRPPFRSPRFRGSPQRAGHLLCRLRWGDLSVHGPRSQQLVAVYRRRHRQHGVL